MVENPLLVVQYRIPFHAMLPAHVEPGIRELINLSRSNIHQLAASSSAPVFENTLLALERSTENLDYALGVGPPSRISHDLARTTGRVECC